jgi:hypothetical protein
MRHVAVFHMALSKQNRNLFLGKNAKYTLSTGYSKLRTWKINSTFNIHRDIYDHNTETELLELHSYTGVSAVTCLSDMVAILSCSIMITCKLLKIAHYKYIPMQETRKT